MAQTTQMITDGNGHISPYKDQTGNPATIVLDTNGNLPVSVASATSSMAINDGVTTSNKASVQLFHIGDNLAPGGSAYGLLTGGVAQLLNSEGNLDRQTETFSDNRPNVGISTNASQNAMPIGTCSISGSVTGSSTAQNITLSAVTGTVRGVIWTVQTGHSIQLGTGTANAEWVFVNSVNTGSKTVNVIATKNHSNGDSVSAFVYNQQRDATLADGSAPAGISANSAYFWNGTLNSGTGGMEIERSAAGEQDGASGQGTALAAEYEWNGGGPLNNASAISGLQFDRARNLQGKGLGSGSISNNPLASGSTSLTLNSAPTTLQAGQQIWLDRAGTNPEANYVGTNYTVGSTTVPLQNATAYSHAQNSTVEWDQFAAGGPGLNGFTPTGIGIEEEALYNPADGKYYIERSATADGMAAANVVAECPALWNGATMDRWPGSASLGGKIQIVAKTTVGTQANLWNAAAVSVNGNSSSVDTANGSAAVSLFGNTSAASTLTLYVSQDNTNFYNSGTTIAANGDFHTTFTSGARYVRLQSSAAVTITATAASKP